MRKTILSLTAALTMFAVVPVDASPVVDSASDVSVNEFVTTEPTVNIMYRSELDVPRNSLSFSDGRNVTGKEGGIIDLSLKPGERKVVEYIQLSKGQKLQAGITWYNTILADGSTKYEIRPTLSGKEIIAEKDGYYLVEYIAPNSDVQEYRLVTGTTTYGKQ
ncbi:hypothetical protein [Paenibacillus popilliae]|uniref:ATPase and permease component n=1 Tax=Paenibacillus popilliae ATCC 14706 TaxID=1212764 RepID=M9LCK3_PAEPP|nr:hypothetical protein [Paenibacillus popilliae]GAC43867.1 ATPase and permease component [Paenibacillus popilliae ATCC 14706]